MSGALAGRITVDLDRGMSNAKPSGEQIVGRSQHTLVIVRSAQVTWADRATKPLVMVHTCKSWMSDTPGNSSSAERRYQR